MKRIRVLLNVDDVTKKVAEKTRKLSNHRMMQQKEKENAVHQPILGVRSEENAT